MSFINNLISNTKEQLKGKYLQYFVVMLIIALITAFTTTVALSINEDLNMFTNAIVNLLIAGPMGVYSCMLDLNIAKYKENILPDIDKVFSKTLKSIAIIFMITVAIYIGIIFLIIPGIYIGILFSQANYILIENDDKTPIECLKESARLMKGNIWKYILLDISFLPYIILSVITLGIYLFWAIPKIQVMRANFYLFLKEQKESAQEV